MEKEFDYSCYTNPKGIKIFYRREIPKSPRGIVIICHGYGEHSGFYQEFSSFLNKNGYGVYAYDHRAHGRSEEERGHIESFNSFVDDLEVVVRHCKQENPVSPLFIFGHSMGGLIAFTYGILHPTHIRGQIFSGPALGMPWGTHLIPKGMFVLCRRFFTRTKVYHILGRRGSRNREFSASYKKDPLILKYATVGFFYEFIQSGIPWAQENARNYILPSLFLHGKADRIIPYQSSSDMFEQISSEDKELKMYPRLYHELVQEPEREQVWLDIVNWLNQRTENKISSPKNKSK